MIRPTRPSIIRRTTSCLADLALNAVATLGCYWQTRWEAYQAGAQAAIRGDDLPFNVVDLVPADDELMSVRQAFADYDEAIQAEEDAIYQALMTQIVGANADARGDADSDFALWTRQFHPSNGGAL